MLLPIRQAHCCWWEVDWPNSNFEEERKSEKGLRVFALWC
jgi:hypothetical protein